MSGDNGAYAAAGVWVGGSTALACAVIAVVLHLSDLETLSRLAGAGSFATAVPSLVLAVLLARPPEPVPPVVTPAQQTDPANNAGPAVFELTTFAVRLSKRISAALQGVALGAGLVFILLLGWTVNGDLELRLAEFEAELPGSAIGLSAFVGFWPVFFFCCGTSFVSVGASALVVDTDSPKVATTRTTSVPERTGPQWQSGCPGDGPTDFARAGNSQVAPMVANLTSFRLVSLGSR